MSRPRPGHWRLLLDVLHRRRRLLLRLAGWSVVEAVPAFLSGHLVAAALDDGFLAERPAAGFGAIGLMAVAVLVGAVGTRQTFLRLAEVVEPFRDELVDLVVTGAMHGCTAHGKPSGTGAVARLTQQVEIVRESFASVIMVVQGFLVTTASALLGLFTLAPMTLAFVLPPVLVGLAVFLGSLRAMADRQRAAIMADERTAEAVGTVTSGLRDIVGCGGEDPIRVTTARTIGDQQDAGERLARLVAVRTTALGIGGWLPVLLILLGTPWLLSRGATTGTILGALTYVSWGLQPALQTLVRTVGGTGLWLLVTLDRITAAAEPPTGAALAPESLHQVSSPARSPGGVLQLRDVTFGYGRHAEPVIRNLDLVLGEHDHLAVVGPSGVGKSTLAGIIAGLLEPQAGRVLLDGVELRDWPSAELTARRVLIPQEAYVFAGTVAENLRYHRQDAERTELDKAVDAVGAGPLIERLGGYQAELRPADLSAGERQLLTLARAYLSPARLAILDEATCHLDPASEARVEAAFRERPGAVLVVAHRITSALRADQVLILDGDHALLGDHRDLLARSPLYRDLVGHWDGRRRNGQPSPVPGTAVLARGAQDRGGG